MLRKREVLSKTWLEWNLEFYYEKLFNLTNCQNLFVVWVGVFHPNKMKWVGNLTDFWFLFSSNIERQRKGSLGLHQEMVNFLPTDKTMFDKIRSFGSLYVGIKYWPWKNKKMKGWCFWRHELWNAESTWKFLELQIDILNQLYKFNLLSSFPIKHVQCC